jgi:adenosylmethionine-8-amino-7-oxononanoate aminotransferase
VTAVLRRDLRHDQPVIVRGSGIHLYDADGNRYLDAVGGAGVAVIGHGVTGIGAAFAAAGDTVTYAYGASFTTPWQEEYAARLRDLARPGTGAAVYFTSGGSEANETAVKLARQYHVERGRPGKHKVIARWHSFHGMTLGTLALSARAPARAPFEPYLLPVPRFATPDCYRCPFSLEYPACGVACAEDLERALLEEGPDTVSAVIVEPLVGTTLPAVTPPPEYYARIRAICDRHDVLLIGDEVLTGFGRTGRFLALDHWDVEADIVTLGKGIGGGYAALGAVVAAEHVVAALARGSGQFVHGFTFSGLPASCLIGLAVLDHARDLFPLVAGRGAYLRSKLDDLATRHDVIGAVRGKGLLAGIEFVADRATRRPIDPARRFAASVAAQAQRRGVLVRPGLPGTAAGRDGDHLQISPPYVIEEEHVDTIVDVLDEVLP